MFPAVYSRSTLWISHQGKGAKSVNTNLPWAWDWCWSDQLIDRKWNNSDFRIFTPSTQENEKRPQARCVYRHCLFLQTPLQPIYTCRQADRQTDSKPLPPLVKEVRRIKKGWASAPVGPTLSPGSKAATDKLGGGQMEGNTTGRHLP